MRVSKSSLLFGMLLLSVGRADAGVLIVDDNPGPAVDHATLQAAVDASLPNDIILVKAGSYTGFHNNGKSFKMQNELGHTVNVSGAVTIVNIPTNGNVVVSGLNISNLGGGTALAVVNAPGPVMIENCRVVSAGNGVNIADAIRVSNSQQVTLVDCIGSVAAGGGYPGLDVLTNSTVWAYESLFIGGRGVNAPAQSQTIGGPGGPGAGVFSNSTLFASGCTFQGGPGGMGGVIDPFGLCANGGPGAHGVFVSGGSVKLMDNAMTGGAGGPPGAVTCASGTPGQPIFVNVGTAETLPFPARTYGIPSPVREGGTGYITLNGDQGEFVWLFFSAFTSPTFSDSLKGTLLPGAPQLVIYLGALPVSGEITFAPLPLPVNPSMNSFFLYEQAIYYTAAKGYTLSNPRLGLVLDMSIH